VNPLYSRCETTCFPGFSISRGLLATGVMLSCQTTPKSHTLRATHRCVRMDSSRTRSEIETSSSRPQPLRVRTDGLPGESHPVRGWVLWRWDRVQSALFHLVFRALADDVPPAILIRALLKTALRGGTSCAACLLFAPCARRGSQGTIAATKGSMNRSGGDDKPMSPTNQPDSCRRLGDFEVVRVLGRGSMGVVSEARPVSLNRQVALKVLSGGLGLTGKAAQRFRREAVAWPDCATTLSCRSTRSVSSRDGCSFRWSSWKAAVWRVTWMAPSCSQFNRGSHRRGVTAWRCG
jgi:hypothetical protein